MAGLINPPAIQNPMLAQAEAKNEALVGQGQNRADYMKIVVAGMRAALANGPQSIIASLKDSQDPVRDCAVGAVNLVFKMRHISRGTMPPSVMTAAAMTLMLQALDFADHSGIVKVGKPELDRATHIFANMMFHSFGVSPGMLQRGAQMVTQQNPAQLEALKGQVAAPQGQVAAPQGQVSPTEGEA